MEDKKYHLGRSDAFCIPRNRRHRYYADEEEPWSILWVHFKGETIPYYPVQECRIVHLASRASDNRMMVLFKLLFRVLERNYTLGNFIYISQVLSLILSEVYFREKMDESTTQDRHVTLVIRYMYQNLKKNLTLSDISQEVQLSKSYLNTIFKTQTGEVSGGVFYPFEDAGGVQAVKSGRCMSTRRLRRLAMKISIISPESSRRSWGCRRGIIRMETIFIQSKIVHQWIEYGIFTKGKSCYTETMKIEMTSG